MGNEIGKVPYVDLDASNTPAFVSGRVQARYAVAALKSKISGAIGKSGNFIIPHKKNEVDSLLGVDITPSCIYVCQVDNKGDGRALTGLASVCMEGKFVGEDILNNPNLYSESLKKLVRENKIKTKKVAVSLPVSSSIVKFATISKMEDVDIRNAIKYGSLWQNLMSSSDSPDNYSIFYQVVRRNKSSETMDLLIVATRLADIKLYKDIVIKSGLTPVIIDAKSMALHYTLKNSPLQRGKQTTVLVEFGLNDNYIIVIGGEKVRVFDVDLSENDRAAILGKGAGQNEDIVNSIVERYHKKLVNIIASYGKINPEAIIENVYVMSALPLVDSFIEKLNVSLTYCKVKECSLFDYLIIEDSFAISKDSAKNSISAWAASIAMAITPWKHRKEEWVEIRKTPQYGVEYFQHYNKKWKNADLSIKIGEFNKDEILEIYKNYKEAALIGVLRHPAFASVIAAAFTVFLMMKSYAGLVNEGRQLSGNDTAHATVEERYNAKIAELAYLKNTLAQMESLKDSAARISEESNQRYVLSMYNYLDTVLQEGVWLKQMTFTAPHKIEIEGRSLDDGGVLSFLGTISDSKMFSKMALKNMKTITERDSFSINTQTLKSFVFKGAVSETLPGDYLNAPSRVAGDMAHGG